MEIEPAFWEAFYEGWRPDGGREGTASEDLGIRSAVEAAVGRARAQWPQPFAHGPDFAAAIGQAVRDADDPAAAVSALAAADLCLATACAAGEPDALAAFERTYGPRLDARVARRAPASEVEELQQAVRRKLFVSDGRPPRIADYRAHGALGPWLKVIVARMIVDAHRRRAPEAVDTDGVMLAAVGDDPEMQYLKEHYLGAMREAFEEAVGTLEPRQRTILRYQVVDQLRADQIGSIYNVHEATVRRWLAAAREQLLSGTRDRLVTRLAGRDEVTSIVRLVRSQLDVSIARLLATDPGSPP